MRGLFFIMVIGVVNCSTIVIKPETRVSPICDFGNERIKGLEFILTESKRYQENLKVSKLIDKIKEYEILKKEIIEMNLQSDEGLKILASLQDRTDSLRLTISVKEEKEGDLFSSQYNFIKAFESYYDALHQIELSDDKNNNIAKQYDKLQKKIQITKENGENFLNNRIKSLIDQAIFLNLDDQISKAKEAMRQAEKELESSLFSNPKIVSLYVEQAMVMNFYDKEIKSVCTTKMLEQMGEGKKKSLPDSFITKSGLKFIKILRKDGKPVYVSEVIRPDKADSWYYARDYAEKMNLEENCPSCYYLPEFEDIENLKPLNIEGLWLKSWSPAPFGMTFGSILPLYPIDLLHDIVIHPFTWQSYSFLISPDSVAFLDDKKWNYLSWNYGGRLVRSALRADGGCLTLNSHLGFRIVRPIY